MIVVDFYCISIGSENYFIIIGIVEILVLVCSLMLQVGKLVEVIEIVLDFQLGRVDVKKFRFRYYDIDFLEIGIWRVSMFNLFIKYFESFIFLICWLFEGSVYDMINFEFMNFIVIFQYQYKMFFCGKLRFKVIFI